MLKHGCSIMVKYLLALISICIFMFVLLSKNLHTKVVKFNEVDDMKTSDSLENDINSFLGNDAIFFHVLSESLTFEEACSIESAALHNANRSIHIYVSIVDKKAANPHNKWSKILKNYKNTEFKFIENKDYFMDTPLMEWFAKGEWQSSKYNNTHLTNYLRMATMFKSGGLYLSLDTITLQPLKKDLIWNAIVFEDTEKEAFSNALFHLEKGHRYIDEILWDISNNYEPNEKDFCGSESLVLAMEYLCGFLRGIAQSNECYDVKILPHNVVHHYGPAFEHAYLEEATDVSVTSIEKTSYVALLNRKFSEQGINPSTLIGKMAKKHCPLSYSKLHLVNDMEN